MSEKIKVGIIGTGSISEMHINGYRNNPGVELCAFCDINPERLEEKAGKYGIAKTYTSAEDMLKHEELDAVSVCTWNSAHASCAIAALNAGVNVLCEKPMSISAKEAALMQQAAEKSGKLLMIGFVRRFGRDCKILSEFINSGFLGEIYYAKASYIRKAGCPGGWFGDKSRSGGGPLIDLGVHVIDLVRYLMGNPKPVSVYGATFDKLGGRKNIKTMPGYVSADNSSADVFNVEDLATAMIRFENGAVLTVETSFCLHTEKENGSIELFGTKGGAKLDPELSLYSEMNDYLADIKLDAQTSLSFEGLFESEIDHFVSCVKSQTHCLAPAKDGKSIMDILDAIYESARTGHEVII